MCNDYLQEGQTQMTAASGDRHQPLIAVLCNLSSGALVCLIFSCSLGSCLSPNFVFMSCPTNVSTPAPGFGNGGLKLSFGRGWGVGVVFMFVLQYPNYVNWQWIKLTFPESSLFCPWWWLVTASCPYLDPQAFSSFFSPCSVEEGIGWAAGCVCGCWPVLTHHIFFLCFAKSLFRLLLGSLPEPRSEAPSFMYSIAVSLPCYLTFLFDSLSALAFLHFFP